MKLHTGLALAAIAIGAFAVTASSPAHAQMDKLMQEIKAKVKNAEDASAIHKRRTTMHVMAGNLKKIAAYLKADKGTAKDVAADAHQIVMIAPTLPDMFPPGTGLDKYEGVTGAKPIIWSKHGEFKAHAEKLRELAMNLEKVASAPNADKKQIAAAFGNLGKNGCGSCHRENRQKLN